MRYGLSASPVRRWGRFVSAREKITPLLLEAALSALQRFLDGDLGIQHGVGPCKRDTSPRFGSVEKDDPFPATWICRLKDFKLDGSVFHGHSSKRRHRKFLATRGPLSYRFVLF